MDSCTQFTVEGGAVLDCYPTPHLGHATKVIVANQFCVIEDPAGGTARSRCKRLFDGIEVDGGTVVERRVFPSVPSLAEEGPQAARNRGDEGVRDGHGWRGVKVPVLHALHQHLAAPDES